MTIKRTTIIRSAALLLAAALPMALSAHDMWFEMKDFNVVKGSAVECVYPSDHAFPSKNKEFVPAERTSKSYLIAPSGAVIPIAAAGNNLNRSSQKLAQAGTYLAVSGKKWTHWVKTTDGHVEGKNKTQVKNAVKGIYSGKFCKAVVTVDKPGGAVFSKVVGQDLEIIPLKDPGTLKKGDILPIKVLLKGKPAELEVKATYDGYSTRQNVYAETIKTDISGLGKIRIGKKGKWLITTSYKEQSADSRLYDEKMYASTLTFQIP